MYLTARWRRVWLIEVSMRRRGANDKQLHEEAQHRAWERFRVRLEAATCLADAMKLYADAPPPDSPGRAYYSNLGFFLLHSSFAIPGGADLSERTMYLSLVERMATRGEITPDVAKRVQEELQHSISEGGL